MIGVYFGGRFGNQFLIYALARALRYERGDVDSFMFDFDAVNSYSYTDGFEDILRYFNVVDYTTISGNMLLRYGSRKQIWEMIKHKIFRNNDKDELLNLGIYYNYHSFPLKKSLYKNLFTIGICENPDCFQSIRHLLLKEFTPKYERLVKNKELYNVIESTESVCVTIRRGDYVTNFKNDFFLCDVDYFLEGIKRISQEVKNPTFIFFSDDITWVKENIKIDSPCYYESGDDPVWEKIRLMYSCKHFIISNSTFSWCAQYLCRNPNKVVISPDRWFPRSMKAHPLISSSFITIKMDK